jgi:hypothetical protein
MGKPFHYMRVEVTVAAAIVDSDNGKVAGNNMVDATLVFGWRCDDPAGRTDSQINAGLTHQMSPVLAVISAALTQQGWLAMGQEADPMTHESVQVGQGVSTPVTVFLVDDEKAGRA